MRLTSLFSDLLQLEIPSDMEHFYFLYPSELGLSCALGPALTDGELFDLCRERGDEVGSLRFFVSTRPDKPSKESLDSGFLFRQS